MSEKTTQKLCKLPKGYRLIQEDGWSRLMIPDSIPLDIGFLLTNRHYRIASLEDNHLPYDIIFAGKLSQYLTNNPKATILDIGGGYESRAMREISEEFPKTKAYNADLMTIAGPGFRADATKLPIMDESIDIAICVQLLSYPEMGEDLPSVVREVERVLKSGGKFFVDTILHKPLFTQLVPGPSLHAYTDTAIYLKP